LTLYVLGLCPGPASTKIKKTQKNKNLKIIIKKTQNKNKNKIKCFFSPPFSAGTNQLPD
jgi:hypothetical protein